MELVADILKERYGIQSMEEVAADPWSVHLASQEEEDMVRSPTDVPRRLVQTFLYFRPDGGDMRAKGLASMSGRSERSIAWAWA